MPNDDPSIETTGVHPRATTAGVAAKDGIQSQVTDLTAALGEIDRLRDAAIAAETRERLLVDELQHRVRNMLASIRSIYRQSLAASGDDGDFAQHFEGRLDALARYQTYPAGGRPAGIEIEDIVRDELLSSHCLDGPRCTINGKPWRLYGKQAELMGLAIHELATNAVKFGALAQDGKLSIAWSARAEGLRFRWAEESVTIVALAPRPSGFGRQLIEEALPYQLDATTSFELRPGGIICLIDLPPDPENDHNQLQDVSAEALPLLPTERNDP